MIYLIRKIKQIYKKYGILILILKILNYIIFKIFNKTPFFNKNKEKIWIKKNTPLIKNNAKKLLLLEIEKKNPSISFSVIIPIYNTPKKLLIKCIESVLNQSYKNWELILINDNSTNSETVEVINSYSKNLSSIRIINRKANGNICNATNDGIECARMNWIAFLDHDDLLDSDALLFFAKEILDNNDLWLIYSDEYRIDQYDRIIDIFFKPNWSPERFRRQNYINHLSVVKSKNAKNILLREGYEGSQDHDFLLRLLTPIYHLDYNESLRYIQHISIPLYSWRIDLKNKNSFSQRNYNKTREIARKSVEEHLSNLNIKANIVFNIPDHLNIKYYNLEKNLVSILIPTKDKSDLLSICINSILEKTEGVKYEIIIINNNSSEQQTFDLFDKLSKKNNIKILDIESEFNFSLLNNEGAKISNGNILCLLNNDIEVISRNWLQELVSLSSLKGIGAVGPTLLYPNNSIQHAGIILGINKWAGHSFKHSNKGIYGGVGAPLTIVREVSAVTGACLVIEKYKFFEVGGLNQDDLKVACNDVDFCLKLLNKGYRNIHTPNVELYHHESASRGIDEGEKKDRFQKELSYMWEHWKDYLEDDPFYNINLTRKKENHSYRLD